MQTSARMLVEHGNAVFGPSDYTPKNMRPLQKKRHLWICAFYMTVIKTPRA